MLSKLVRYSNGIYRFLQRWKFSSFFLFLVLFVVSRHAQRTITPKSKRIVITQELDPTSFDAEVIVIHYDPTLTEETAAMIECELKCTTKVGLRYMAELLGADEVHTTL
jgi:hypothetical protein